MKQPDIGRKKELTENFSRKKEIIEKMKEGNLYNNTYMIEKDNIRITYHIDLQELILEKDNLQKL